MIDLKNIKNIILDLGGVILDLDFESSIDQFKKLGITDIVDLYQIPEHYPFFKQFEIGLISPGQLREEIRKATGNNISDDEINDAWNIISVGFTKESIETVLKLNRQFRLFLLSNTNAIHEVYYNNQLFEGHGIKNLTEIFEKVYYSHDLHMRKPDAEIFEFVLNDSKLIPEETLFVDDTLVHIETASSLGIKTYHLSPPQRIEEIFSL
ncbi:MAG: HAD family phosphatase [Bacteroidales bacterium]|nr:HAD family phosphatase [Bacteroidales bacterium]